MEPEEEEKKATRPRRKGNKKEKAKEEDTAGLDVDLSLIPKEKITYHSLFNLKECHNSVHFQSGNELFFNPVSSEIHLVQDERFTRAYLVILDKESNQIEAISLEESQASSLAIWNAAVYLYFDKVMAERFPIVGKQYKDCILYADLRQSFTEGGNGRGMVVFYPVLKNADGIMRRTVIADDSGIYILGGLKVTNAKKSPLAYSNACSFYEIEPLEELTTKVVDTNMDSMQIKRDDLIVTQNKEVLFVMNRTSWNPEKSNISDKLLVEIFDKDQFAWTYKFEIPYDQDMMRYSVLHLIKNEVEQFALLGYRRGKNSSGYIVEMSKVAKSEDEAAQKKPENAYKKIDKIIDNNGAVLVLTGYETFQLQNSYANRETILVRNYKKEPPEVEEFLTA